MDITKEKEFKQLYDRYFPVLLRTVYKIVNSQQAAEDLVHEVFLKLWEHRNTLRISSSEGGYLRKAAINASLNYLKRNRNITSLETLTDDPMEEREYHNPERQQILNRVLNRSIEALPPKCRLVFSLSRFEGMSNQEIADYLVITRKTVENQLNKAFSRLRKDMAPYSGYMVNILVLLTVMIFF